LTAVAGLLTQRRDDTPPNNCQALALERVA
jgi:hypothetical protein